MNGPEAIAAFMFFGGTFWVLRPVAAAVAKRIAGEHRRPVMDTEEREEMLAELQQVRQELSELAERMDFAERMLAKPRDAGSS
jgi:predicted transcriptional regulator